MRVGRGEEKKGEEREREERARERERERERGEVAELSSSSALHCLPRLGCNITSLAVIICVRETVW